jgi:hypothetical protein
MPVTQESANGDRVTVLAHDGFESRQVPSTSPPRSSLGRGDKGGRKGDPWTRCVGFRGLFKDPRKPRARTCPILVRALALPWSALVAWMLVPPGFARKTLDEMQSSQHLVPPAFPANGENEGRSCQRPTPMRHFTEWLFQCPPHISCCIKPARTSPSPHPPQSGLASDL